MNDVDLAHRLVDLGVKPDVATALQSKLDGRDLVSLTNALNSTTIASGVAQANKILGKYGVHIQEASNMSKDFDYLSALFAGARTGATAESVSPEWLTPISESNDPLAHMLTLEGFNYVATVEDARLGDKLIDWLDENQVDYLNNGAGQYHIKCADRESAYRVGSAIGRIMRGAGRDNLRDSTLEEKDVKNNDIKGRNPIAIAMAKRGGNGAHNSKNPDRKDPHSRAAKHKGKAYESDESIEIQDELDESASSLNEGLMAVTPVNPILRLRELAGLPPAPLAKPAMPAPAPAAPVMPANDISVPDDMGADLDMGPDVVDDFSDPTADVAAPVSPMDAPMDAPVMGGVPGDLPPGGPEMPMTVPAMPVQSEAFSQIEDALNNIQTQLGDVKLSEYKSIVKKLEDLAGQVRVMGRDYLGERRLKP